MQDTIIKGTGNSRTLGSVPNFLTLYPTYEAFAQALVNKQLPIDLGPPNAAGVQTMGDALNKANLLKDATAALYGLPATAVPDDVLAKARELIASAQNAAGEKGNLFLETGSYAGTGVGTPMITFTKVPAIVYVSEAAVEAGVTAYRAYLGIIVNGAAGFKFERASTANVVSYLGNDIINDKTLDLSKTALYLSGVTYRYYALCT